jgi:hypothetical protein
MRCVQNLAYNHPEQALQGFLNLDRESMPAGNRNSVLQSIFGNQTNPETASGLLSQLDNEADREIARQFIQNNGASVSGNPKTIATAKEWLEQAEILVTNPTSNTRFELDQAVQTLNKEQLAQLGKDFQTLPPDSRRTVAAILSNSRPDTEIDPNLKGQAISYLISNPAANDPSAQDPSNNSTNSNALASTHAVKWAQTDPAAASAWTSKLPDGEAKSWANKNLAATWMQYDPAAAKKWISNLPAGTRNEVQQFLDSPNP